jgi:hypothetical protein
VHITYYRQSTFVIAVNSKKNKFVFMADRSNKRDLKSSAYLKKTLNINDKNEVSIGENED